MKNNKTILVFAVLILAGSAMACSMFGGSNSNSSSNSNANSNSASSKDSTPAIEITADALGKEWLANPAETDSKYSGKTLSVTGPVYIAQVIGEQVFVDLTGVVSDAKIKGARISCGTTANDASLVLVKTRELNERMLRENPNAKMPPPPIATLKGVYLSSTPPDRPGMGIIDLKPCELLSRF